MFTFQVLDPVAQNEGETKVSRPASRSRSLDGLTLGLLWNGKRGGEVALMKAGELVSKKYKNVKINRYDGTIPLNKELLEKARQECDVFIGSTAD